MYVLYSTTLNLYIGRDQQGSVTLTPHISKACKCLKLEMAEYLLRLHLPETHHLFQVKEL